MRHNELLNDCVIFSQTTTARYRESARHRETRSARHYCMMQYHPEGPDGDQHDLVQSQKSCSGSTEMESNCGYPMSPMGQRGLDDDEQLLVDFTQELWVMTAVRLHCLSFSSRVFINILVCPGQR